MRILSFFAKDFKTFLVSLLLTFFFYFGLSWLVIEPVTGTKEEYIYHLITWTLTLAGLSLASATFNLREAKETSIPKHQLFELTHSFVKSSIFFISYFAWLGISCTFENFEYRYILGYGDFNPVGFFQNLYGSFSFFVNISLGRILTMLGLYFFSIGLIDLYKISKEFAKKFKI